MSYINKIKLRVKKQETPFYAFLYRLAKSFVQLSIPHNKPFHSLLYNEWCTRTASWHNFWRIIYYEPMFKSQCKTVGRNFRMEYAGNGTTRIAGNLNLCIGDNVTIFDNTMFAGLKVLDNPELIIGDNSYIGPLVRILVGQRVIIGKHSLIASKMITDNPGHPVDDVMARVTSGGGSPTIETIRPVTIGDFCFLPLDTIVYPGVTIGDGVVARVGTHINKDVPPFCQIAGNPMRIIKKLPIPDELKNFVDKDRFESYLKSHALLNL